MEDAQASRTAAFEFLKTMAAMARHNSAGISRTGHREDVGSIHFRIWATLLHSLIFILGVVGNVLLIWTVRRTRGLRTSTYAYLVSLAWADIIVLLSAVPEAIVAHHTGFRWRSGQVGCSVMIFTNFLGINAGSLSIFAFTLDRYIASVQPMYVLRVCNWKYARKATLGLWFFAVCYCLPWLALTEVRETSTSGELYCDFRFSRRAYMYWFAADLVIFYLCPLIFAAFVFCTLSRVLRKSIRGFKRAAKDAEENQISAADSVECNLEGRDDRTATSCPLNSLTAVSSQVDESSERKPSQAAMLRKMIRSRTRVYRTLVIIVIAFAVTWIPYRALLIYNSLVQKPWYDFYYLFFAKTCIYFNCCFNPYLYNAMSGKFRRALVALLLCAPEPAALSMTDRRPRS